MVITMLEAKVDPTRVPDLERAFGEATAELPPEIVETFLLRNGREVSEFRICTVWRSREALEAMRASGATPKGVQMFQAAGATPSLTILEVIESRHH